MDISSENSIKDNLKDVFKNIGSINIVINCAGVFSAYSLEDIPDDEKKDLFVANIMAPYYLSEEMLNQWSDYKGTKKIVYISSIAGLEKNPTKRQAYAYTKKMIIKIFHRNFTRFFNKGIDFICVCPGPTNTKMWRKVCKSISEYEGISEEEVEAKYERSEKKKVMEPRETAKKIVDATVHGINGDLFNLDEKTETKFKPDYSSDEILELIDSIKKL